MYREKDWIKKSFLCGIIVLLLASSIPIFGESIYGSNYNNVNIPDNNTWVYSSITISGAPAGATVTGIDAYFKCTHTYSGDLDVDINDQNTTRNFNFWQNEGGSADNPTRTVSNISTFNGLPVNGTWYLWARDTASGDTGYIDEWWIRVYYTAPSQTYAVYGIIDSLAYGTDADGDGYYETYSFRVGVDGDVSSGSTSIYAKIVCTTTGQSWWSSSPWTITGTATDYHYFSFNQSHFSGYITGNTSLDFTVELWNSTKTTRLATDTTITGEPVKADYVSAPTYAVYGLIDSLAYGTDADGDGYYETYSFRVGVDGDVSSGSASIYAKIICTTTGQSWWSSSPWTITGTATDYHYFAFNQSHFSGYITGNTSLDFTVELWNSTKTTKLATDTTITGEPVKADYVSAPTYAVYGLIDSLAYGTDADGDGYYETYSFRVGVDGDVSSGSASIYAKIICTTTGQSWWSSSPWTITGTATDYHYFAFNQSHFSGYITGNTGLDFTVELWNSTKTTKLATDTTITGEPVKADYVSGPAYAVYGIIDSLSYGTDADGDGYYETYSFRVGVDGDLSSGSASIYAKIICNTTGQSWWSSSPWTISGTVTDYHYFSFNQTHFSGYVTGNTGLDFTVELWNSTKTTKLATDTTITGEPVKADYISAPPYTVSGVINSLVYGTDKDTDGYYETFSFRVGVNGDMTSGSASIYAKIICNTTGQSWWFSSPWTISGTVVDYHYFSFTEANFSGKITGNTNLDFSVEIWNSTKATKLAQDTTITGEPIKADYFVPTTVRVYGTLRYADRNNTPRPIRYAKVEIINDNPSNDNVYTINTDGNGYFSKSINNIDSDGSGADIFVRVYTDSVIGAYPGATTAITEVLDDVNNVQWSIESPRTDNNVNSELEIQMPTPVQGTDQNAAFSVFDSIVEAFIKAFQVYSKKDLAKVIVHFPAGDSFHSAGIIHLLRLDRWDRDVILHEYGHFIQNQCGFQDGAVGDNRHSWNEDLRTLARGNPVNRSDEQAMNLAFREAWPTFFAISVQFGNTGYPNSGDSIYQDTEDANPPLTHNLETDTQLHSSPGQFYESMNCCILWDIFDNNSAPGDNNDTLNRGNSPIWNVVNSTDKPDRLNEFWNAWFKKYAYNREITRIFLDHRISFIAQAPTGPNPPNGSSNQPLSLTLDWNNSANAASYDVYLGTTTTPVYLGITNTSSYPVSSLNYGQTYYWRIIAKGGNAEAEGPVWSFTTLPRPGTLSVSPADGLSSSGAIRGPFSPSSKTCTLTNIGISSINWTVSKTVNWLSLSSSSGTLAAGASVTVKATINSNANTLAKGTYSDNVIFKNTTNNLGNTSRSISLNVAAPAGGYLSVTPADGLFSSGKVGGPFTPTSKTYTLTNTGTLSINWSVSKTVNWLTLSPLSGTLAAGASTSVRVTLNTNANALTQKDYNTRVTFSNTTNKNGDSTRPVSLIVSPNTSTLSVAPLEDFVTSGVPGGQFTPSYKSYTLTNTGEIPIDWMISKTNRWLSISESSGTLLPGTSKSIIVSINENETGLADVARVAYNDTLVFTNNTNGNGNTTLTVALKVDSPTISSLSPDHGPLSTPVTITGTGFDTTQGKVTFNGTDAIINSWSDTEIETVVPHGASTGPVVVQTILGNNSNGANFTVITSSTKNQADLDGDGKADILWRYYGTGGYNAVWLSSLSSNVGVSSSEDLTVKDELNKSNDLFEMTDDENKEFRNHTMESTVADPRIAANAVEIEPETDINWQLCGAGDFNGDGKTDLVWQNLGDGRNAVWYMDGLSRTEIGWLPPLTDLDWRLCGTGDFNNDGKIDLVWQHLDDGLNMVWYMNGLSRTGIGWLPPLTDLNWRLCGTGDFNNDGKIDLVWQYLDDSSNMIWYMDALTKIGTEILPNSFGIGWKICGTGDIDNDGKVDLLWRNTIDGRNAVWYLDGVNLLRIEYLTTVTNIEWMIEN